MYGNKRDHSAIIVGSGPSARDFCPPKDITVIAVNGAIEWLSRADHWFTLDPSAKNLRRMGNPVQGVHYHSALPANQIPSFSRRFPDITFYERLSHQGIEPSPQYTPEWWFWRWGCVPGLSERQGVIHSGNSAYGAVGLAYLMGFKHVALIGIDGTNEARVEGGCPANLSHLPLLFSSAREQLNIMSCGKLAGVPFIPFEQWYQALNQL